MSRAGIAPDVVNGTLEITKRNHRGLEGTVLEPV